MTLKHPRRPRLGRQIHPPRVFVSSREAPVPSTLDLEERVGACLHGGASHDAHSSPVVLSVALRAGIVVGEPPAHPHLPEGSGQPSASGAVTHLHPAFVSPGEDAPRPRGDPECAEPGTRRASGCTPRLPPARVRCRIRPRPLFHPSKCTFAPRRVCRENKSMRAPSCRKTFPAGTPARARGSLYISTCPFELKGVYG